MNPADVHPRFCALIPAFNEARHIADVVKGVIKRGVTAIVIDDGSTDGTADVAEKHSPDDLPRFMDAYRRTGIPVLIGNRMDDPRGMPWMRRRTNRFMSWLLCRHMNQYIPDTQNGYRLYQSDVLPLVFPESYGFAAESEILLNIDRMGVRMDSVPVQTIYGDEESSINPVKDTVRFFKMLRRFARKPGAPGSSQASTVATPPSSTVRPSRPSAADTEPGSSPAPR
jgi:glycosyltransferase involved in cell wall biosynthesis